MINKPNTPVAGPNEFEWGVATSSFQIEGARNADGRTDGIWDAFCAVPKAIADGTNADVAAGHYHRLEEDLDLVSELGVDAYRFSISWSRIFPDPGGQINTAGMDFYQRLCDGLIERGVKPVLTLYHWDLPLYLHQRGGWLSRHTVDEFVRLAEACFANLGDRVHRWCTINEPWCQAVMGYATGEHAPGGRSRSDGWQAAHHLLLAHGRAVLAHQESPAAGSDIGIVLNLHTPRPMTRAQADREAVDRFMDERNRLFLDPLLGRPYPQRLFARYRDERPPKTASGDMDTIARLGSFLGVNYYDEQIVTDDSSPDGPGWRLVPPWGPTTDMGWPVVPSGLERHLYWVAEQVGPDTPLVVTENGVAVRDDDERPRERDSARIMYMATHLNALARARAQGVNVRGYYHWTLMDNFEWAEGLAKRFGLVHVNYRTGERTPRASYHFYRDYVTNGPSLGMDALDVLLGETYR